MSAADVAKDTRGLDFWQADIGLRELLPVRLDAAALAQITPHLASLGVLAGGQLDEWSEIADKHGPVLHPRDRFGNDEEWIEYCDAYRRLEQVAFGDLGLHAMSHRSGVLGFEGKVPSAAKYATQYLFSQAEFSLMCPVSLTDTAIHLIAKFGSEPLKQRLLPRMLSQDMATFWRGAQFITETAGGSDVGAAEVRAEPLDTDADGVERWRLYGDKWFCSHADADAAIIIARRPNAPEGHRGLALFVVPKTLEDGSRNSYRIVRLKDKLGTKGMASGEITFDGAIAYLLGDAENGLKQSLAQINLSRLSNGVRAAGRMRRAFNEAMSVATSRRAFGTEVLRYPLLRRQLMKILVPTEQALSMVLYTAAAMDRGEDSLLRILTPLIKMRACRDCVQVASTSMEVRGGNGYIEDFANARILRDAQVGPIWEGTANINAIDVVQRAAGREDAHRKLADALMIELKNPDIPEEFTAKLEDLLDRAIAAIDTCLADGAQEANLRTVASMTYHVTSAILLAAEGAEIGASTGDARRLLLADQVVRYRINRPDPFAPAHSTDDEQAIDLLLAATPVSLDKAHALISR
ncbi:MAG: acyl-CoA dehydrogenase family protein [Antricoccus sp.]